MWILRAVLLTTAGLKGFFNLKRELRQGYPLSPYLFIICVETLATIIRAEKNIKGIRVGNEECKISQYADDLRWKPIVDAKYF